MKATLLPCGNANILTNDSNANLSCLDRSEIERELKHAGLLVLRGFEATMESFRLFASQFSSQMITSPGDARSADIFGDGVQFMVPDGRAQDLHQENGTIATRPDLLWFYCARPAEKHGETTYADGVRVWQNLDKSTRKLFLSKRLKYSDRLLRQEWLTKDEFLNVRMHVGKVRLKGSSVRFDESDVLIREYVTSAVNLTRWGKQPAFANSLRGPYVHTVTFEDNSLIPEEIIQEIGVVHARLTQYIAWQAGDIAMIDNTRYIHGRCSFLDAERRHFSFMSLANF